MSTPSIDAMIGKKYGLWTVLEFSHVGRKDGRICAYFVRVKCDCGTVKIIQPHDLSKGSSKSCGCERKHQQSIRARTHGHKTGGKTSRTYSTWQAMRNRCYREKDEFYMLYGGRGIIVCDRWKNSFENFVDDMGIRPDWADSIERIDTNGNYEPSNCKWATTLEQNNNRRSTLRVSVKGESMSLKQACAKLGVSYRTVLSYREYHKMGPEDALRKYAQL